MSWIVTWDGCVKSCIVNWYCCIKKGILNCAKSVIKTESVELELCAKKIGTLTLNSCHDNYIVVINIGILTWYGCVDYD